MTPCGFCEHSKYAHDDTGCLDCCDDYLLGEREHLNVCFNSRSDLERKDK